jgi:hypothetical protein
MLNKKNSQFLQPTYLKKTQLHSGRPDEFVKKITQNVTQHIFFKLKPNF